MLTTLRWLSIVSVAIWAGVLLYLGVIIVSLSRLGVLADDVYWVAAVAMFALAVAYWIGFRAKKLSGTVAAGAEGALLVIGAYLLIAMLTPHA
jgi:hypothetical protein